MTTPIILAAFGIGLLVLGRRSWRFGAHMQPRSRHRWLAAHTSGHPVIDLSPISSAPAPNVITVDWYEHVGATEDWRPAAELPPARAITLRELEGGRLTVEQAWADWESGVEREWHLAFERSIGRALSRFDLMVGSALETFIGGMSGRDQVALYHVNWPTGEWPVVPAPAELAAALLVAA